MNQVNNRLSTSITRSATNAVSRRWGSGGGHHVEAPRVVDLPSFYRPANYDASFTREKAVKWLGVPVGLWAFYNVLCVAGTFKGEPLPAGFWKEDSKHGHGGHH